MLRGGTVCRDSSVPRFNLEAVDRGSVGPARCWSNSGYETPSNQCIPARREIGVGEERPRALAPQAKPVWSEDATPAKQQITTSLPSGSTDGYQETATLARRGHS